MKRRGLTPEEKALWQKVMRSASPLHPGVGLDPPDPPLLDHKLAPNRAERRKLEKSKSAHDLPIQPRGMLDQRAVQRPAKMLPGGSDPFSAGNPRIDRHVHRGRMEIDAVLDLHGHTQLTARTTLLSFLTSAHAQGYRCVLVITGKGGSGAAARMGDQSLGKGILRARMKDWLRESVFRQLITRASSAHPKHGGGGAFYVFLKSSHRGVR